MSSCPHVLISSCPPVLPVTLAILRFSPEEGVVAFRNPYGKVWQWRREPCIPVTAYPDYLDYLNLSGLEGALAPPMGCPRGSRLQKVTSGGSSQWACSGVKVRKEYKKVHILKLFPTSLLFCKPKLPVSPTREVAPLAWSWGRTLV